MKTANLSHIIRGQPTKNQAVRINNITEEVYYKYIDSGHRVTKEVQVMGGSVDTKAGNTGERTAAKQLLTLLI